MRASNGQMRACVLGSSAAIREREQRAKHDMLQLYLKWRSDRVMRANVRSQTISRNAPDFLNLSRGSSVCLSIWVEMNELVSPKRLSKNLKPCEPGRVAASTNLSNAATFVYNALRRVINDEKKWSAVTGTEGKRLDSATRRRVATTSEYCATRMEAGV